MTTLTRKNRVKLSNQVSCTTEAKDFKNFLTEAIPVALETTCIKYAEKQKQLVQAVIRALMEKQTQVWYQLVEKYDKEN